MVISLRYKTQTTGSARYVMPEKSQSTKYRRREDVEDLLKFIEEKSKRFHVSEPIEKARKTCPDVRKDEHACDTCFYRTPDEKRCVYDDWMHY